MNAGSSVALVTIARAFLPVLCALMLASRLPFAAPVGPGVRDLLNQYERGEYDDALRAMAELPPAPASEGGPFDRISQDLRDLAPEWIAANGPVGVDRRRLVLAAFAADLVRARPDVEWRLRYPLMAWACDLLRSRPTHLAAEQWWYLASLAEIEEAGDWADALDHLTHATAAFPNEHRFLLADAQYHESQTFLGGLADPPALSGQEASPAFVARLGRVVAGGRVAAPFNQFSPDTAQLMLDKIARIPAVAREYAALSRYEDLGGDVDLHLGFLQLRTQDWDGALDHLRHVPQRTTEPLLIGLSHFFSGWAYQRTGRHDDAITEYRHALELAPRARSASILLAAELAQTGRQAEGYVLLGSALTASPAPDLLMPPAQRTRDAPADPWLLYRRGDAGLAPTFLARLREALK
jgi:tetratricopeptide (TPR) repeat protein